MKIRSILCGCIIMLLSCNTTDKKSLPGKNNVATPGGYNFGDAQVVELIAGLNEISGLVYNSSKDSLYAIEDEDGSLFAISIKDDHSVTKKKFSKKKDFEEVVLKDGAYFVLISNGDVVQLDDSAKIVKEFEFNGGGGKEFESMIPVKGSNKLLLICKDCEEDKKKASSIWSLDLATGEYQRATFKFSVEDLDDYPKGQALKLSGAAVHPTTGDLYAISSVNKSLFVADSIGVVKSMHALDKDMFRQPEGIAFLPSGDMVIANEKSDGPAATLVFIKMNK